MTTIYVAWHSIFENVPAPWNGYNKHSYLVRDLDGNTANIADQEIIRGGVQSLTFEQAAANLITDGTFTGPLAVEAGVSSSASADGLNNTGDSDGDGFLNNDKDRNGIADTVADRHYTAVNLAPAFAYLGTSDADVVWSEMEAYAQDLEDSDFGYRFLTWNCQATMVSVLSSVKIDFFSNVPTGSTYTEYVSRDVLLSGDGGYALFGFAGNDKIYDTGGNDTFHGGDGSVTTALNYLDGTDRIHYVGEGDVTYRYVVLGGGNSSWNAIQTDGMTVSTDTLYSVEQFRGANYPSSDNVIDFSGYGTGLTIQDKPKTNYDTYKDDSGDVISSLTTTELGAGNLVSLIDMNRYIGTNFADTFSLIEVNHRTFDGAGGADKISFTGSRTPYQAEAMHIATSVQPHHAGKGVAINVETFETALGDSSYFVVEKMGSSFTTPVFWNTVIAGSLQIVRPSKYVTLSYREQDDGVNVDMLNHKITNTSGIFDTVSDSVRIFGSDNGDTYSLLQHVKFVSSPTYRGAHYNIPIFTGAGDDTINYNGASANAKNEQLVYGGGNDTVNSVANVAYGHQVYFVMPLGVDVTDMSYEAFNIRTSTDANNNISYVADVRVTIGTLGTIVFADQLYHTQDANPVPITNHTLGGVIGYVATETELLQVSFTANVTNASAFPTVFTRNSVSAIGGAKDISFYNGFYHGTMNAETMDLSSYILYNNFYAYDGDDTVLGSNVANIIYGGDGNDRLTGNGGNDTVYGNDGSDTAIYGSAYASYTLTADAVAGSMTVAAAGAEGSDTLFGIERIEFSDGVYEDGVFTSTSSYVATTGNDTINASAATSAITLSLLAGNDSFIGSAFNDVVSGDDGTDSISGGDGNDVIEGGVGDDTLAGGNGTDTVSYANAASAITFNLATTVSQNTVGAGADTVSGFEDVTGSALNDTLTGDANANTIDGGNGNDVIEGGAGNDTLSGGAGTDRITFASASAAVTVNLATATSQNTGSAGTDTISGFENLTGSAFNDALTGDANANVIDGGNGNDTIQGGDGNDTLTGGAGTDTASYANASAAVTVNLATTTAQNTGGAGTDTIATFENLTGSAFNDTLTGTSGNNVIEGGAGNDTINAQGGTDTLTYANASGAVTVNLATTTAQNTGGAGTDTISNFENLTGSAFSDVLTGNTAANTINGGDGDDIVEGGAGNDVLAGSNGIDTASYFSAGSAVTVNLATTTGQNTGGAGTDTITGFENLKGSAFNDTLTGNGSANVIEGGAGNDTINGAGGTDTASYANASAGVTVNLTTTTGQNTLGAGTDTISNTENLTGSAFNDTLTGTSSANTIRGGDGNDTINGGGGNDILYGSGGQDTITGSTGGDVFMFENASAFSNVDTVTDFNAGAGDKFDMNDVISPVFDPLQHTINQFVDFRNDGGNSIMSVDRDGTGTTYSFVDVASLTGVTNLDETTLYNNGNLLAA